MIYLTKSWGMTRRDDHETSVMAAAKLLPKLSDLQQRVLRVLRKHKQRTGSGLTDKELERLPEFSVCGYSTIRKRRSELYKLNLVCETDQIRDGCKVWEPVSIGELIERQEAARAGRLF